MKIIRLTDHRVRVFLSEVDLLDMRVNISELSPNSAELNMFLGEILSEVKRETGFHVGDGKVLAEAMPDNGGIIIDLCRISEKKLEAGHRAKRESMVFEFSEQEALYEMIKNIPPHQLLGMRLYSLGGKFYMAVPKKRAPAIMYEFSLKNSKSAVAESKVAEYGKLLAGGYRLMSMRAMLKKIN